MSYAYRRDLDWLVTDFTARVPDAAHAVVVSADGLLAVPEGDTDLLSYEMTLLVEAVGEALTPAARGQRAY